MKTSKPTHGVQVRVRPQDHDVLRKLAFARRVPISVIIGELMDAQDKPRNRRTRPASLAASA